VRNAALLLLATFAIGTTVLARQRNPTIRIVPRATTERASSRLRQAGADSVVAPAPIGGMRRATGEYVSNPPADTSVSAGCHLIVMGDPPSVAHLGEEAA